jgi:hypothetical protein
MTVSTYPIVPRIGEAFEIGIVSKLKGISGSKDIDDPFSSTTL